MDSCSIPASSQKFMTLRPREITWMMKCDAQPMSYSPGFTWKGIRLGYLLALLHCRSLAHHHIIYTQTHGPVQATCHPCSHEKRRLIKQCALIEVLWFVCLASGLTSSQKHDSSSFRWKCHSLLYSGFCRNNCQMMVWCIDPHHSSPFISPCQRS